MSASNNQFYISYSFVFSRKGNFNKHGVSLSSYVFQSMFVCVLVYWHFQCKEAISCHSSRKYIT